MHHVLIRAVPPNPKSGVPTTADAGDDKDASLAARPGPSPEIARAGLNKSGNRMRNHKKQPSDKTKKSILLRD